MAVTSIILAAGASSRLGQPKQLLEYRGEGLLARTLRMATESGAVPVLVVLGAQFAPICATVPFNDAIPVLNDQWQEGIASSIHAGLNELDVRAPQARGVLMLTCDQPRLNVKHLRAMLKAFSAHAASSIIASSYAGVQGIPAIFPRSVFPHLQELQGDKGARSLLIEPPCPVISLPFDGGEVDIDEPTDLAQLE